MTQELLLTNFEAQAAVFATAVYALLRQIFPCTSLSNVIRCNIPAKIPRASTEKPTPCGKLLWVKGQGGKWKGTKTE